MKRVVEVGGILFFAIAGFSFYVEGKKLVSTEMDFLNAAFESIPPLTARIKMSCNNARRLLEELEQATLLENSVKKGESIPSGNESRMVVDSKALSISDQAFVKGKVEHVLNPLKEFFRRIREHQKLVLSLMRQSYVTLSDTQFSNLYLIQFLSSPSEDIVEFFSQRHLLNKNDLTLFCREIVTVFGDFIDSMSDKALSSYREFLKKIQKSHDTNQQAGLPG